jgi:hypothetical protein
LFALALRQQAAQAKKWPVVSGVIKLSGLEQYRAAPRAGSSSGTQMYERKVSFSYRYNDVAYTGLHAASAAIRSRRRMVLRLFGMDFCDGASVKVWVNPNNPSEATLDPRPPSSGCCG